MTIRKMLFSGLIGLSSFLTGCTTAKLYSGERPDSEIAIVKLSGDVQIFTINGKGAPHILQSAGYNFSEGRIMKMLPGSYTATGGFFRSGWTNIDDLQIRFSVEAGKRYYLGVNQDNWPLVGLRISESK